MPGAALKARTRLNTVHRQHTLAMGYRRKDEQVCQVSGSEITYTGGLDEDQTIWIEELPEH